MKICMTGATGFVGSRALLTWQPQHTVNVLPSALLRAELTPAHVETLHATIAQQAPDVLFHAAAISDTGYAEQHPQESYAVNVALPLALAHIAHRLGVKLIACSSDQVYNGCDGLGPFAEQVLLTPTNVYGQHKRLAEMQIAEIAPEAVSLRLSWMYDMPVYGVPTHRNLLTNLLAAAMRGELLTLSTTDYRGVTYVRQVIEILLPAMTLPGGVYNFGSESAQNVYQIAGVWAEALGIDPSLLHATQGKQRSLCMDCTRIRDNGIVFDETTQGVRRCMRDYGLDRL